MLWNKGVTTWAQWSGLAYNVHIPAEFVLEGSKEEVQKGFGPHILWFQNGPCADKYGSHDFFSSGSKLKEVKKSEYGLIAHLEENPGSGSWKDAVYQITHLEGNLWKVNLLFYAGGSTRRSYNHNKFVLGDLDNKKLEMKQLFLSGGGESSEVSKDVYVFQDVPPKPQTTL